MSSALVYGLGLALLAALGVICGRRLGAEYRTRLGPGLQTVALVWAFYGVHFSLVVLAAVESRWHFSLPEPLALAGGLLSSGIGAIVYVLAVAEFRSLKRLSGLDSSRLVTEGIYRWSRNPQVVGWALVVGGLALVRQSGMVLLLAVLFWVSFRLYLPLEEELLGRIFGDSYDRYRRSAHRYFGPPKRAAGV